MSLYYLDTSALAKRYVTEVGSVWIREITDPSFENVLVISEIAIVEVFSVLAYKAHRNEISSVNTENLRTAFLDHVEYEYVSVKLDSEVLVFSRHLVTKHISYKLRTLDAIHLSSALRVQSAFAEEMVFVCADDNLIKCAGAEGLKVEDPRSYA